MERYKQRVKQLKYHKIICFFKILHKTFCRRDTQRCSEVTKPGSKID